MRRALQILLSICSSTQVRAERGMLQQSCAVHLPHLCSASEHMLQCVRALNERMSHPVCYVHMQNGGLRMAQMELPMRASLMYSYASDR